MYKVETGGVWKGTIVIDGVKYENDGTRNFTIRKKNLSQLELQEVENSKCERPGFFIVISKRL